MPIEPETKDWTWVLREPCIECGFDPERVTKDSLPVRIRTAVSSMHGALHGSGDVRERPDDSTWSRLEYAAHVRDVCRTMRTRLGLLLDEDEPVFPNWDQDATAVEDRYNEQAPERVAIELDVAGATLADGFAAVQGESWDRRGTRSNGSAFTVLTLGVYALHDLEHHVVDVAKQA